MGASVNCFLCSRNSTIASRVHTNVLVVEVRAVRGVAAVLDEVGRSSQIREKFRLGPFLDHVDIGRVHSDFSRGDDVA